MRVVSCRDVLECGRGHHIDCLSSMHCDWDVLLCWVVDMPAVQWRVVVCCWCDVVCVVCCWDVLGCEWWDERCCLQWMHDTWDVCECWVVDVLSVQWRMVIDDWSDGMHIVCCWDVLECERCHAF